jgi:hypothetical protein
MNARPLHEEMRNSTSWLATNWSYGPLCAAGRHSDLPVDSRRYASGLRGSVLSPWLPNRENRLRRVVALLSILAIVLGTAIAVLPGRWGAAQPASSPATEQIEAETSASHAPAGLERSSSVSPAVAGGTTDR